MPSTAGIWYYWLNTQLALLLLFKNQGGDSLPPTCKGTRPSWGHAWTGEREGGRESWARGSNRWCSSILLQQENFCLPWLTSSNVGWGQGGPSMEQPELRSLSREFPSGYCHSTPTGKFLMPCYHHHHVDTRVISAWTSWRTSGQPCVWHQNHPVLHSAPAGRTQHR